jgi:hypothetical protein
MAELLAKAAPPAPKPCFTVDQNEAGDWIARERQGAIMRVFATQKAAIHFVLFELGAHCRAPALAGISVALALSRPARRSVLRPTDIGTNPRALDAAALLGHSP